MYQKDYILRMIEMLADLIALIMGLIKKGDYDKASERLGRVYYDMLKQDASFFTIIPDDQLIPRLLEEHNFTNSHLEILAELFNTEAELSLAKGNRPGSLEYSRKALRLFSFIDEEQKTYIQERLDKITAIRERISLLESGI